jgi:outer membrane protein assembly factor BamB
VNESSLATVRRLRPLLLIGLIAVVSGCGKPAPAGGGAKSLIAAAPAQSGPIVAVAVREPVASEGNRGHEPSPNDWPQWQGQARNDISPEKGLLQDWPKDGPPLVWKVSGLGGGYSTPSIAAGRVFGMGAKAEDEVVWALAEADGKELWTTRIAAANARVGYGEGPRSTPTVDGNSLYALGVSGDLACLDTATGKIRWQKNIQKEFGGTVPNWGYSESPLIDDNKVVVTPGGNQATVVALDKTTGATIWKAVVPTGNGAAYASIIAADVSGHRQYIQFLNGGVVGIAAAEGKFLWNYPHPANGTANCSTPIYSDGYVFAASGYSTGGGLVRLSVEAAGTEATEVYFTKHMKNHHGGMVLVDGYVYGADDGLLTCLDFHTGALQWSEHKPGKGSIAYADGRLYFRNENGTVTLSEANPQKYIEHGRFEQPDRSPTNAWPHPVIANGKLYLRDQGMLFCYDVKDRRSAALAR